MKMNGVASGCTAVKPIVAALFIIQPANEKLTESRHLQRLKTPLRVDKLQTNVFLVMAAEADKSLSK